MKDFGFVRVAAAIPLVKVAQPMENVKACLELMQKAEENGVQVVCFPELCITGYTCADLFHNSLLTDHSIKALEWLLRESKSLNVTAIIGLPLSQNNKLYNTALTICQGKILAATAKSNLPNYNEFYEKRWFAAAGTICTESINILGQEVPFGSNLLVSATSGNSPFVFSIEICEDLWVPCPPSGAQALAGSQIIFNLSASDELLGKHKYLRSLIEQQSARCNAAYVYAGAGFGESSTDLYFGGNAIIAENGKILTAGERFSMEPQLVISDIDIEKLNHDRLNNSAFQESDCKCRIISTTLPERNCRDLLRCIDPLPFVPSSSDKVKENCQEIFNIQTGGLAVRLQHIGAKKLVVGISGGLDSTLALLVAAKTFDKLGLPRKNIVGITMPGFGTTGRTYRNALAMMQALGVTIREISIKEAVRQHFSDIGHDESDHDVTYENSQARERTQILMDLANAENAIVLGTGDLSELALGWCTYNGDHMSMYAVNAGVPKTLVKYLVKYVADHEIDAEAKPYLYDVIDTPISPELLPADQNGYIAQKTEDLVGPYELHDFFLYHFVRNGYAPAKILMLAEKAFAGTYDTETISGWLKTFCRRFFNQQFKRSCLPDGPKVGSVALSPRGDWRMPSDASAAEWMDL